MTYLTATGGIHTPMAERVPRQSRARDAGVVVLVGLMLATVSVVTQAAVGRWG